jgi:hypothetical protein
MLQTQTLQYSREFDQQMHDCKDYTIKTYWDQDMLCLRVDRRKLVLICNGEQIIIQRRAILCTGLPLTV